MKQIKFWRMLWTVFVVLYAFVFFRNLFTGAIPDNRTVPIAFFAVMVLWMAVEFYFEMPFFQSGLTADRIAWRVLFALFFYPFLAYCVADFAWLGWTQIRFLAPAINYLGIAAFLAGSLFRLVALVPINAALATMYRSDAAVSTIKDPELRKKAQDAIKGKAFKRLWRTWPFSYSRHPRYLATIVQIFSIPFAFSSYLGIVLALGVGLPIILKEVTLDDRSLTEAYKPEYDFFKQKIPLLLPVRKKR